MADVFDSLNPVDEEESLEKARVQESLHKAETEEEHFKQNIMMDVDERPDGIKVDEKSENQQVIKEVAESDKQAIEEDPIDALENSSSSRSGNESSDNKKSELEAQTSISSGRVVEPSVVVEQGHVETNVAPGDPNQDSEGFSAFELQSVDQQIEEALISEPESSVGNVNDIDINIDQINESASIGDVIGITAFANDPDDSDSVVYSLSENPNNAFALDMYGDGKVANHPDDAKKFMQEAMSDPIVFKNRFLSALEYIRQQENVDASKIAAIGYCFGGAVVLNMARSGVDLKGVASFHGSLATKTPAKKRPNHLTSHGISWWS
jgi:hypothetical protein